MNKTNKLVHLWIEKPTTSIPNSHPQHSSTHTYPSNLVPAKHPLWSSLEREPSFCWASPISPFPDGELTEFLQSVNGSWSFPWRKPCRESHCGCKRNTLEPSLALNSQVSLAMGPYSCVDFKSSQPSAYSWLGTGQRPALPLLLLALFFPPLRPQTPGSRC